VIYWTMSDTAGEMWKKNTCSEEGLTMNCFYNASEFSKLDLKGVFKRRREK
jgi:hypothetical protein